MGLMEPQPPERSVTARQGGEFFFGDAEREGRPGPWCYTHARNHVQHTPSAGGTAGRSHQRGGWGAVGRQGESTKAYT